MKKIIAGAVSVAMIAGLALSVSALPDARTPITVYYATPTIDGTINTGEWDTENRIDMTADNCAAWAGEIGNAVYFYYSWDDSGLYVAAQVNDTDLCLAPAGENVYSYDAFQIALDPEGLLADGGEGGGEFFSMGLMEDGTFNAVYHPYGGAPEEFEYTGMGHTTTDGYEFEMMIPWSQIEVIKDDGYNFTPAEGSKLNSIICMLDRDEDCSVTNAYKTAIAGAETSFSPADYALQLVLSKKAVKDVVAEQAGTDTTAAAADTAAADDAAAGEATDTTTTAPTTADAGIVAAVAVMAVAAGVVLSKKH